MVIVWLHRPGLRCGIDWIVTGLAGAEGALATLAPDGAAASPAAGCLLQAARQTRATPARAVTINTRIQGSSGVAPA